MTNFLDDQKASYDKLVQTPIAPGYFAITQNINAYLLDAPNVFIENRGKPPHGFPKMIKG